MASRDGGADVALDPRAAAYAAPSCQEGAAFAPIRNGTGGHVCTRMGADPTVASGWPNTAGAAMPVVYVRPNAMSDGSGTADSPRNSIAAALESDPGTVVLPSGVFELPDAVIVGRTVTILGAGASAEPGQGTVLRLPASGRGIVVDGASAVLTLARLSLHGAGDAGSVAVLAQNGATADLREVLVRGIGRGVAVEGAHLRVDGLSVLQSEQVGVRLGANSDGTIKRLLVRDGTGPGLFASNARVNITEGMVAQQRGLGLALTGDRGIDPDRLERVVSLGNEQAGLYVAGRQLEGTLLLLADTRQRTADGAGGDGLVLRSGARVALDRAITSDEQQGHGSAFIANARAGVLASEAGTELLVHGALVGSNGAGGVIVQNGAQAVPIGYSLLDDNRGIGAGAFGGGSTVSFVCDGMRNTRLVPVQLRDRTMLLGDGLLLAGASSRVLNSQFSGNERYAAMFVSSNVQLDGVTVEGNANGLAADQASMVDGASSQEVLRLEPTEGSSAGPSPSPSPSDAFAEPAVTEP